jgi:hypothetical protein
MYHGALLEDMKTDRGREFLAFEISEELGDRIRDLNTNSRHLLQNAVLRVLESEGAPK